MLFSLKNSHGMEATVSNYGCMLMRLIVPDKQGNRANVVLGLEDEEAYVQANTNYGGIVGRYANRIGGGGFELDGSFFPLAPNLNGNMHLHGGYRGFNQRWWEVLDHSPQHVRLRYLSPDGEEGYPGAVDIRVEYRLDEANKLHFECEAQSNAPTVISLSHHAYFNLSGSMAREVASHHLQLHCDHYLPTDKYQLPLFPLSVNGTPFDFRFGKNIGQDLQSADPQIKLANGYDHCFITKAQGQEPLAVATLSEPESGRRLDLWTNQPGLQMYTANYLSPQQHDYTGVPLQPYHAVCLEPQQLPDAPNRPDFPSPVLRPGEIYRHKTIFAFSWG
jgi:aldose 1-epimerase